ncbi:hypothetical protein [Xanthomonas euvesicatoria]|uniref:hypothetical protein n=1 Tax=Xanthomonas euvesicatoria TaxID=456327 RepID=UPI0004DEE762|nr:hypothetical protein [Xanthomonas euvesicatoria]
MKKTTSLLVFFLPVVFAEADDGAHCVALSVLFHRAMPISSNALADLTTGTASRAIRPWQ